MSSELLDLLDLNDLSYLQSTDASVALNRQQRKFYPEKTAFSPSEVIRFHIHGKQFMNLKNAVVKFDVTLTGTNLNFSGGGSMANFINRVRVISSNGKEISDVRKTNLMCKQNNRLYRSKSWENVIQSSIYTDQTLGSGIKYPVYLPIRLICEFFNNEQLLPPELTEGMVIEFYLEKTELTGNANYTSYLIENPELVCDMSLMSDSINMAVKEMSQEMLVYEYTDYVHAESNSSNDTNVVRIYLPHVLSNALECYTTLRLQATANGTAINNFNCLAVPVDNANNTDDQLLYRIGGIDLPQQRVIGGNGIYNMLLYGRHQLESDHTNNFNLTTADFSANGFGCYFADLRRSQLFNTSGREVSNQNSLSVEIRYSQPLNTIVSDIFVKHIARVVIRKGLVEIER